MKIKTRRQAAKDGDRHYRTGRPCREGHDSPRYTCNGVCVACNREAQQAYRAELRGLNPLTPSGKE